VPRPTADIVSNPFQIAPPGWKLEPDEWNKEGTQKTIEYEKKEIPDSNSDMLDEEEELIYKINRSLVPVIINYIPASGSQAHVVSSKTFTPTGFSIENSEDRDLREDCLLSPVKEKVKKGLNATKHGIADIDLETLKAMVREVKEEARKKEPKGKPEEDESMEEDGEMEGGNPKLERPIKRK